MNAAVLGTDCWRWLKRSSSPLFAVPALRELESFCRVSTLWDVVTVPTVCCSGVRGGGVTRGGQQQFATQTLRVHLLGQEKKQSGQGKWGRCRVGHAVSGTNAWKSRVPGGTGCAVTRPEKLKPGNNIRRKPKGDGGKGTGKKMSRQFATTVTTIYDMVTTTCDILWQFPSLCSIDIKRHKTSWIVIKCHDNLRQTSRQFMTFSVPSPSSRPLLDFAGIWSTRSICVWPHVGSEGTGSKESFNTINRCRYCLTWKLFRL